MAIISQKNLFSWKEVEAISDLDLSAVAQAGRLSLVLEAIGDEGLMQISEKKRKGMRDDYPIRAVWNSILAGIVYQHVSIESLMRELLGNGELRELCGFNLNSGDEAVPPKWVYTRFSKKLIKEQVEIDKISNKLTCLRATHRQIKELKKLLPDIGEHLAIDSKPLIESFRGGKKDPKESSDSEADWGVSLWERR